MNTLVVWQTVQSAQKTQKTAIKQFIVDHEPDIVPIAEHMRAFEGGVWHNMRLFTAAWSAAKVVGLLYMTDTRSLFPYWDLRDGAAICQALAADRVLMTELLSVHAITGRVEVVERISALIGRSAGHNRRTRIRYQLMSLDRAKASAAEAAPSRTHRQSDDETVRITQATIHDLPRIFPLHVSYLQEEVQPRHQAVNHHQVLEHLKQSLQQHTYFIAWHGSQLVAKANSNAEGYHCAQLGGIFTQRTHRNQGIAYRCTAALCTSLFSRYTSLVLFVKQQNRGAASLYRAIGFRPRTEYAIHYIR